MRGPCFGQLATHLVAFFEVALGLGLNLRFHLGLHPAGAAGLNGPCCASSKKPHSLS